MKAVLDKRKCPAIPACPEEAISYIEDTSIYLGGRIIIVESKCNECGLCVTTCCGATIEMK